MDEEDLEPVRRKGAPVNLEEMSIEAIGEYIADLEAEVARAREAIRAKEQARAGAHSLFSK